eukprot:TRINITY_DN177_c0_g1_i13.p1 TRINITY_DN177_c0_g1~~TRINITY_DN177_c0_g1_i13.p1  ORF type:complete len:314 (-),score=-9.42 TRINITY_DN177_c0_g1_i13:1681-2583(-)
MTTSVNTEGPSQHSHHSSSPSPHLSAALSLKRIPDSNIASCKVLTASFVSSPSTPGLLEYSLPFNPAMGTRKALLFAVLAALLVVSCSARKGGGGGGRGGVGQWWRQGNKGLGTRVGALQARLNGSEATAGDVNATGVVVMAVFQNGTDYTIRYGASIRLTKPEVPDSLAINSGAAGEAGTPVLVFGAFATWQNLTWNGTRRDHRGRWRQAAPPKYYGFFTPGNKKTGYVYGFSGTWYSASTLTAADGTTTYKDLADQMLANPSGYFAIATTTTFSTGAARGQFGNLTRATPKAYWERSG